MISVIICSRSSEIEKTLLSNIQRTIGCDYELIFIDNSENKYSIFAAYNLGMKKSKGNYLCFLHDDIYMHTLNWGLTVERVFNEANEIGILGVAGAKIKTKTASGWWNCPDDYKVINIIQHINKNKIENWYYGFKSHNLEEVVTIDGVFMVVKNGNNIFFNEKLNGFHNYDFNICLEAKMKDLKIFVTNEILIEHFSNGIINQSWYQETSRIHRMYENELPLVLKNEIDKENLNKLEAKNGYSFLKKYLQLKIDFFAINLWCNFFVNGFSANDNLQILKILIKRVLKRDVLNKYNE